MASPKQVKVDPKELEKAQALYANFINAGVKSVIAITVVLVLLALLFL